MSNHIHKANYTMNWSVKKELLRMIKSIEESETPRESEILYKLKECVNLVNLSTCDISRFFQSDEYQAYL